MQRKSDCDSYLMENIGLVNAVRSNGRSKHPEDINVLQHFMDLYNTYPKLYRISSEENYYDWKKINENLTFLFPNAELIFSDTCFNPKTNKIYNKQETWKLKDGVLLQIEGDLCENMYLVGYDTGGAELITSYNLFLINGNKFEEFEDVAKIFKFSQIEKIENISIGMVSYDDGSFYVKDFDLKQKTFELQLLDEHYGNGFEDFSNELIEKLKVETKGLTLFYGVPGSGKTMYIRHLLRKLKENSKFNNILYFPPTMVDTITDPSFINFISEWVTDSKGKNYLLIEDAEPLLESRDKVRNIGITNLLNLTDGLLNDILNVQIIATFNTDLKHIDKALLRPERLIARKEFKKLPITRAKYLASIIGVDPELVLDDMTLAEIYSFKNDSKTITHDIEDTKKPIGFNS